jgi:EAL domain-containing protein (putative c-di-GMP-specific phosphodiesterase class I)/CheY-like chemotaxis protein
MRPDDLPKRAPAAASTAHEATTGDAPSKARTPTAAADASPVTPKGSRILVVEDDDNLAHMYQIVLRASGFEVDVAADGRAALEQFQKHPADLVITDLTMPGMDGMALLQRIRDSDLDVPVMIVTAAPHVESAMRAVEFGAHRYLSKPVKTTDLIAAARHAVTLHEVSRMKRRALAAQDGTKSEASAELEATFEDALQNLYMSYQPIISWSRREIIGYEALVRSTSAHMSSPATLFEAARNIGRFRDLGRQIRRIAPLPLLDSPHQLFINIDASDLSDETLFDAESLLCSIAPRVVVELTERVALHGVADACDRLARLRAMGFALAIDDLGAGYAGLSYFAALQPDICKLDMSLVRDIDASSTKQKIVAGMTRMCRDLNIMLVCEGVETPRERDVLVEMGCDALQGYLFARPKPELALPVY